MNSRSLTARCSLLLAAVLAWLGVWLVSPALRNEGPAYAAPASYTHYPCAVYSPKPSELDDCMFPGSISPAEIFRLLLPDLRTMPPHDLDIVTLADGSRELRLSNTVWNDGAGPLELEGAFNPVTQSTRVVQHVYQPAGTQISSLVGEFTWHETHDHWHFEKFSLYELWTLTPAGGLDVLVSSSDKVSYCVIDTEVIESQMEGFSPLKRYGGCGHTLQGLSVGWGDTYKSYLDGQSIQLGAVEDGFYALKSTANPDGILVEADYDNNTALIYLDIRGEEIALIDLNGYIRRTCQQAGWWTMQGIACRM